MKNVGWSKNFGFRRKFKIGQKVWVWVNILGWVKIFGLGQKGKKGEHFWCKVPLVHMGSWVQSTNYKVGGFTF